MQLQRGVAHTFSYSSSVTGSKRICSRRHRNRRLSIRQSEIPAKATNLIKKPEQPRNILTKVRPFTPRRPRRECTTKELISTYIVTKDDTASASSTERGREIICTWRFDGIYSSYRASDPERATRSAEGMVSSACATGIYAPQEGKQKGILTMSSKGCTSTPSTSPEDPRAPTPTRTDKIAVD